MRVFYSHAERLYGSPREKQETSLIEKTFPGCEVVDPSKLERGKETGYYLGLVDSCDALVFSRYFGNVTQGVKPEIERAFERGKQVYEVRKGSLAEIKGPVSDLPVTKRLVLRARNALGMD